MKVSIYTPNTAIAWRSDTPEAIIICADSIEAEHHHMDRALRFGKGFNIEHWDRQEAELNNNSYLIISKP